MAKEREPWIRWREESEVAGPPTFEIDDVVGVAWYDPATFSTLRAGGVDLAPGCPTWEAWFKSYQLTFVAITKSGAKAVKVPLKAATLAEWLRVRGGDNDEQARTELLGELLRRRLAEGTV